MLGVLAEVYDGVDVNFTTELIRIRVLMASA